MRDKIQKRSIEDELIKSAKAYLKTHLNSSSEENIIKFAKKENISFSQAKHIFLILSEQ